MMPPIVDPWSALASRTSFSHQAVAYDFHTYTGGPYFQQEEVYAYK